MPCGARGFQPIARWVHDRDIAWRHAPGFTRSPPRWGAFREPLVALDGGAFEAAPARWAEAVLAGSPPGPGRGPGLEPIAPDGEAVRGGIGRHEGPCTCSRRWPSEAA